MKNLFLFIVFSFFYASGFGNAKPSTGEFVLTHEVFFNTDEYELTEEEFQKLIDFIKGTKHLGIKKISIIGFCDDRGSFAYNKSLSKKRANKVKDYVFHYKKNVNNIDVLNVDGKGELPLKTYNSNLFKSRRSLNRKVIIAVEAKQFIAGAFYAEDLKSGDYINLKTLKFKTSLRYLEPESFKYLDELADFMVKREDIYFTVNGHVCCTENGEEAIDRETGSRNLSYVRAKYIYKYLVKKGVDPKRANYRGLKGKYHLGAAPKEDRRVELKIRYIKNE